MDELEFICWYETMDEGSGSEIKATSVKEAARIAIDIWRHKNFRELEGDILSVYVRSPDGEVHKVDTTTNLGQRPHGEVETRQQF